VFEDQIACADLVVLNKTDLMDAATRARAEAAVAAELGRAVKILPASFGRIEARTLLGIEAAAEDDLAARPSHHELEGEDHDHDDFESFALRLPVLRSPEELLARLAPVIERHDILRVKGFLAVAGKEMRLLLQGVGARLQHYYDRPWDANEARDSRLVVIGLKGLDRAAIAAALGAA
jgi:cobalamin biosynthesis protein CobW